MRQVFDSRRPFITLNELCARPWKFRFKQVTPPPPPLPLPLPLPIPPLPSPKPLHSRAIAAGILLRANG
jgi:hypothetical protein